MEAARRSRERGWAPGSNLTPASLLRFARQHIANYKLPYGIHLLPELPLLASGKHDRAALARSLREEVSHASPDVGAHLPL